MPNTASRLIIFTRYPEPSRAKTRLIPALGPSTAAMLHSRMTLHTITTAQTLCDNGHLELEIRYGDTDWRRVYRWLEVQPSNSSNALTHAAGTLPSGCPVRLRPQGGADLGQRMHNAFVEAQQDGCPRTIIIGTDVPGLTRKHLDEAFQALANHDLVLGPAADGGYYLVGLRAPHLALFAEVPWGTERVLKTTLALARQARLGTHLLPQLADIDRPEDLRLLAEYPELAEIVLGAEKRTKDAS